MSLLYRDLLLEEFQNRRALDPGYSLRAFARDIGLSASKLSQNLRGLCGISTTKARAVAEKLKMPSDLAQLFIASVESQHGRSGAVRDMATAELVRLHSLSSAMVSSEMSSKLTEHDRSKFCRTASLVLTLDPRSITSTKKLIREAKREFIKLIEGANKDVMLIVGIQIISVGAGGPLEVEIGLS